MTGNGDNSSLLLKAVVAGWAVASFAGTPSMIALNLFDAWRWEPHNAIYDQMLISIYVALGLCLLPAIRAPRRHWSLLGFVVLSSLLHGGVMLFHAATDPAHRSHLLGDAWLFAGGLIMGLAMLRERGAGPAEADDRD